LAPLKTPVKIALVSYTNTLPFQWALKHNPPDWPISIISDYPSRCAEYLLSGAADIALLPVGQLKDLAHYTICSPIGIAANGPVDSVKVYSQVPLNQIKTLLLDYQSKTSAALVQLLCRHYWKIHPEFKVTSAGFEQDIQNTTAALVIGDRTFAMNGRYPFEFDLAEHWYMYTGMPFVFAVWVSLKPLDDRFLLGFETCLNFGLNHIDDVITNRPKTEQAFLTTYLKHRINYRIDAEKHKALQYFLALIS